MSFKILNIVVKCSRSFFRKAPIRPLLKRTKARTGIFLTSPEIITILKYEKLSKLGARNKLFESGFFLFFKLGKLLPEI